MTSFVTTAGLNGTDLPKASTRNAGIVQLTNEASDSESMAITPKGVKKLIGQGGGSGQTTHVPDANGSTKGIVKLSDATNGNEGVGGATAATPKAIKSVNDKIGELNNLQTSAKGTLVQAINEIKQSSGSGNQGSVPDANATVAGKVKLTDTLGTSDAATGKTAITPKALKWVNDRIGDINQLQTTAKGNVVAAINEIKQSTSAPAARGAHTYMHAHLVENKQNIEININSEYAQRLSLSGAVTINFTKADLEAYDRKLISCYAKENTSLTINGVHFANKGTMPQWGNKGTRLIFEAIFINGEIIINILDNSQ